MDKLLLRPEEAAVLLGVSRSKMYALLASREVPSVRLGGSLRVPVGRLQEWLGTRCPADSPETAH